MTEMEQVKLEDTDSRLILQLLRPLRLLSPRQIACIDRMLADMGPYGEVRLVKKKGLLRFIERVESEDAP